MGSLIINWSDYKNIMSKNLILDKLEGVKGRFEEVGRLLNGPDVMDDMKKYIQLNKEYKELSPVVAAYKEYKNTLSNIDSAKEMLSAEKDEEMREMAKSELDELTGKVDEMEENLKIFFFRPIRRTTKMQFLKSGQEQEAMRPVFLQVICSACIQSFVNRKAGKWRSPISLKALPADYKEIIVNVRGEVYMAY